MCYISTNNYPLSLTTGGEVPTTAMSSTREGDTPTAVSSINTERRDDTTDVSVTLPTNNSSRPHIHSSSPNYPKQIASLAKCDDEHPSLSDHNSASVSASKVSKTSATVSDTAVPCLSDCIAVAVPDSPGDVLSSTPNLTGDLPPLLVSSVSYDYHFCGVGNRVDKVSSSSANCIIDTTAQAAPPFGVQKTNKIPSSCFTPRQELSSSITGHHVSNLESSSSRLLVSQALPIVSSRLVSEEDVVRDQLEMLTTPPSSPPQQPPSPPTLQELIEAELSSRFSSYQADSLEGQQLRETRTEAAVGGLEECSRNSAFSGETFLESALSSDSLDAPGIPTFSLDTLVELNTENHTGNKRSESVQSAITMIPIDNSLGYIGSKSTSDDEPDQMETNVSISRENPDMKKTMAGDFVELTDEDAGRSPCVPHAPKRSIEELDHQILGPKRQVTRDTCGQEELSPLLNDFTQTTLDRRYNCGGDILLTPLVCDDSKPPPPPQQPIILCDDEVPPLSLSLSSSPPNPVVTCSDVVS